MCMRSELSYADDFTKVLEALGGDVDADSIGAVHAFFRRVPPDYVLEDLEQNYVADRGLDGLENLGSTISYFSELQENSSSKFSNFTRSYPGLPEAFEEILTPVNQGFSVGQAPSTRAEAGFAASQLVEAGLAEKNGVKKTYRMTEQIEDYRMVEDVVRKLEENCERM